MLPIPSMNFIPKIFRENYTEETTALTSKIDDNLQEWLDDAVNLKYLFDADRCPGSFLLQLGNYLNAGIASNDSEATRRKKIYYAIENHKLRSTWPFSAKTTIDAITGYDAVIVYGYDTDDWIECGDGIVETGTPWAIEGGDGTALYLGILEVGAGTEPEIPGNVYVDCHYGINVSTLTAAQIAQITAAIQYDIIPAYMIIYLGYIDVAGSFQLYGVI